LEGRVKWLEGDVLARDRLIGDLKSQIDLLKKENYEAGKESQRLYMEKMKMESVNRRAITLSNGILQLQIL
jgi:hypothetical protein